MTVKFTDVVSKGDMIKISILLIVAAGLWVWLWTEMQKPILPEGFTDEFINYEEMRRN